MNSALWLTCALLACSCAARAQWPHVNKKLTSRQITIRKVVLLPAQVSLNRIGTRGSEGGIAESDRIAGSFYAAVSKELSSRGVEVLPNPLGQAVDDTAKYAVADLQTRYDSVAVQLRRKPGRAEKGRFTLGDQVAKFEPGGAADALVFIRGSGQIFTPGRKALAVVIGSPLSLIEQFHGEVTLADSKTGEVLAFVRFVLLRNMTAKTDERLAQTLRFTLHDVPLPLPPLRG
jgi:hypothetical protein